MNPCCPEPNCHRMLRVRHLTHTISVQPCPKCKGTDYKRYVNTPNKEGMVKCLQCKTDYELVRREGYGRFWVCPDHPWQKFKVGGEVIMCKCKPKSDTEIYEMLKPMQFQKTREKQRAPTNVQLRPRA